MKDEKDIENQIEAGGLFTHSALSIHAERINRIEAFLYGLADELLERGHVTEERLRVQTVRVADELSEKRETLSGGVQLRVDDDAPVVENKLDCAARMHICKAVCCRLSFPLSAPEVESGKVKWELGKPYFVRRDAAGCCVHLDGKKGCEVYQDRPRVCRGYSCEKDERIWKDFDKMVLNQEWIDENLKPEHRHLVAIRMDRVR